MRIDDGEVVLSSGAPAFAAGAVGGSLDFPIWEEGCITINYPV
ncbi:hypothetical protein FHS96_000037 [Sphingomonas zeicaulis]